MLAVPSDADARALVTATIEGTIDVDGTILHAEMTWGDGTPPHALDVSAGAPRPTFEHAYDAAGLYDVELAVTDDEGLIGRARTRITVAPPPDSEPPSIVSMTVTRNGVELAAGDRIAAGPVDVTVRATDLEAHLDHVDVNGVTGALYGGDATVTVTLALDGEGDAPLEAIAHDSFGFASAPARLTVHVLGPNSDTDGDGLVDLDDPDPSLWNGLDVEVFTLAEDIGEDLLGNQHAEDVVTALDENESTPIAQFTIGNVDLDVGSAVAPLSSSLPDHGVDVSALFALRYTGVLVAPEGSSHVIVEVTADDVGVVFLDDVAVASADDEYASDFFRFTRAPAESEPIAIPADRRVPLRIVVGNGDGPYAWSIRFRFLDGETTIMNPEAVSQRQFLVQE